MNKTTLKSKITQIKPTLKRNNVRVYILGKNCKNHFFLKINAFFLKKMMYIAKKQYLCISSAGMRGEGTIGY